VVHGHVQTKVSDAHCNLPEPVDEGPQGLSLLLADANQGNGRQGAISLWQTASQTWTSALQSYRRSWKGAW